MTGPEIIVVMGVSGAGKSKIGQCLAGRLHAPFQDGDDLHPTANIAKMAGGVPLTDADRAPWLDRVAAQMAAWRAAGSGGVIACSALKRAYRDRLAGPDVLFIYLAESRATIEARLARRTQHFMPRSMIDSQFADLEIPGGDERAITSHPAATPEARCGNILKALAASEPVTLPSPREGEGSSA